MNNIQETDRFILLLSDFIARGTKKINRSCFALTVGSESTQKRVL